MEHAAAAGESAAKIGPSTEDGISYRERPHPLALFWPGIMLAAAVAVAVWANGHLHGAASSLGIRAEAAPAAMTAARWLLVIVPGFFALNLLRTAVECFATRYVVKGSRVTATTTFVATASMTIHLDKVETVTREQGPIERLLDVGTVTFIGTSGGRESLVSVRKFKRFMRKVERTTDAPQAAA